MEYNIQDMFDMLNDIYPKPDEDNITLLEQDMQVLAKSACHYSCKLLNLNGKADNDAKKRNYEFLYNLKRLEYHCYAKRHSELSGNEKEKKSHFNQALIFQDLLITRL